MHNRRNYYKYKMETPKFLGLLLRDQGISSLVLGFWKGLLLPQNFVLALGSLNRLVRIIGPTRFLGNLKIDWWELADQGLLRSLRELRRRRGIRPWEFSDFRIVVYTPR